MRTLPKGAAMLPEFTREELAAGLDRVVHQILEKVAIQTPPVNAFVVAKALGISVAMDDRQDGRARYVRLTDRRCDAGRPTVLLKPEPRAERRQWALAHEIGEHVACHVFATWGVDPAEMPPNARETVANHLATRLLLPTDWFLADGKTCQWDLLALKAIYRTASHELIARRMLECRLPVIISIFDHSKLSFRGSNMPGRVPPPSPQELECWHAVHRGNQREWTSGRAGTIRGWSIHEPGWKREILRVEIDEFGLEPEIEYSCMDADA
jgi:Zn-dependent peptidase ImmA (M78 family)